MKLIRRIVISSVITLLVVCCGAVLLLNWSALGYKTLAIPTGSMRPTMPPGSLVLVHSVSISSLKVGDVITYNNPIEPGHTVTHRIVKAYKINGKVPAFVTKGDANKVADQPIVGGLVVGKVAWHAPYLGSWLMWSKTWIGIAVMVYLPALFITVEEIQRLNKYFKQSKTYKLYADAKKSAGRWSRRWAIGFSALLVLLFIGGITGSSVAALFKSNTVALTNNKISVAPINRCVGNTSNNNNVTVANNSSQSGSSGISTSTGNTNSGSSTSGNASNNNSTTTTITITNC